MIDRSWETAALETEYRCRSGSTGITNGSAERDSGRCITASTKWATYLLGLKNLCEGGKGTPYQDDVDIG
jgi:hypothetical protein